VKGRLLTGENAMICTRAPGSCPLQEWRATTSGRHTAVCLLREGVVSDWQEVSGSGHASAVRCYMTAGSTVEAEAPLSALARAVVDAHVHRLIVVDQQHRPIGTVSGLDVLDALAHPDRSAADGWQDSTIFRPRSEDEMVMFQTLVHPTDFDEPSKEAFRVARSLAQALDATVVVFHVVPHPAIITQDGRVILDPHNGEPIDLWAEYCMLQAETRKCPSSAPSWWATGPSPGACSKRRSASWAKGPLL
jgi:hypothetical protein